MKYTLSADRPPQSGLDLRAKAVGKEGVHLPETSSSRAAPSSSGVTSPTIGRVPPKKLASNGMEQHPRQGGFLDLVQVAEVRE